MVLAWGGLGLRPAWAEAVSPLAWSAGPASWTLSFSGPWYEMATGLRGCNVVRQDWDLVPDGVGGRRDGSFPCPLRDAGVAGSPYRVGLKGSAALTLPPVHRLSAGTGGFWKRLASSQGSQGPWCLGGPGQGVLVGLQRGCEQREPPLRRGSHGCRHHREICTGGPKWRSVVGMVPISG